MLWFAIFIFYTVSPKKKHCPQIRLFTVDLESALLRLSVYWQKTLKSYLLVSLKAQVECFC